jgi:hypothetical protein
VYYLTAHALISTDLLRLLKRSCRGITLQGQDLNSARGLSCGLITTCGIGTGAGAMAPLIPEPPERAPGGGAASRSSKSVETRRVGVLVMPSGAVPEGRGSPLQPKGVGLPGITRRRVGFLLKILD